MLLDLIPFAERRYRQWSTQPNAYALNSLVDNARDIVRELQAVEGKDALLRSLVVDSMQPCIRDSAQAMVDMANTLWLEIDSHVNESERAKARDAVNKTIINGAKKVDEILRNTRERILENVADPPSVPQGENKRRKKTKKLAWK